MGNPFIEVVDKQRAFQHFHQCRNKLDDIGDELDIIYKEIERLADLNKAKGALIKAQAKKIWMLWKEKEWLLEAYALDVYIGNDRLDDHKLNDYKNEILEEMQQVLKEEE